MRAIVAREIGPPERLAVEEIAAAAPGPGEVAVDVKAAAVNYPDLLVVEGKYQIVPPLPFVPGKECAGVVAALGPAAESGAKEETAGPRPGERVMVQVEHGAFAERVTVPARNCFPIPDAMGFAEAAALGVAYLTAWLALVDRARVRPGERVLVTGASGSVGLAAMQLAKAFGCRVIAGVATMAKAGLLRDNGADHVIDLSGTGLRDSIREAVRAATGGGVDAVIEMVGGETFEGCLRCLDWCGRLVVVGFTGGAIPAVRTNYLLLKNVAVTGVNYGAYREREPGRVRRAQAELCELYGAGKIRIPVQETFALEEFVAAFDVIRDRRVRGKVVLSMDGGR